MEVLVVIQAHPEWNSTQILQELGRQDPERELSACPGAVIQGVTRIHQQIRAYWEEPWPIEVIQAGFSAPHDAPLHRGDDTMPPLDLPSAPLALIPDLVSTPGPSAEALNPSSSTLEKTEVDPATPRSSPGSRQPT